MKRNSIFIKTVKMNKIITLLILSVLLSTILAIIIATSLQSFKFYYINQWLGKFSLNGYMHAFESENRYFAHDYFLENKRDSFDSLLFSSISDIKLQDIRTLVSREIPGMSKYYSGILVAGEGTDFTNIPNESSIPMEDITKKREVDTSKLDELKKHPTTENKTSSPKGTHSVLVYHSHSWESFLPLIPGATKLNEASSPEVNVSLLGNKLKELLEAKNIPVVHDSTNMSEYLATKGLNWETAYKGSRQIVQATLAQNKDIKYLIDLHRDDARKKQTTKIINGKSYARLFL